MLVTDAAPPTSILVAFLILLNVVLGYRQELKAGESVAALSNLRALGSGSTTVESVAHR